MLALFACEKENTSIGVGLLPGGGNINSFSKPLTQINARTIDEDSLRTDSLNSNILGAINDPDFGTSSASLVIQPLLSEFGLDFDGKTLDSITLSLKFDKAQILGGVEVLTKYGNLESDFSIDVYKLDEDLAPELKYYSDFKPTLGDKIGSFTGPISFFDSALVVNQGDSSFVAPELRFKLENSFGTEMLTQPALVYSNQEEFLNYLKGIVLVPNIPSAPGEGAIVGIEADNPDTKLTLFYGGTESLEIGVGNESERIGVYEIDIQNSNILNQMSGTGSFNTTYVQSMGSSKVRIDLPELDTFIKQNKKIVINEAKLEFELNATMISEDYGAPVRMLMLIPSETDGRSQAFIDYIDDVLPPSGWRGFTNYGGEYNSTNNKYTFHFNRYLQQLIDEYIETGENNFRGFYLTIPSDFPITPSRAVLNTDAANQGIKVSVTYTKLN